MELMLKAPDEPLTPQTTLASPALGQPQQCECTWVRAPPGCGHRLGGTTSGDSRSRPSAASENVGQMKVLCDSARSKCNTVLQNHFVFLILLGFFLSLNTNTAFFVCVAS